MIARALVATVVKDVRLLVRDRVGLVFLTIAPLIVMSVAGFSLSTLFGGTPQPGAYDRFRAADAPGVALSPWLGPGLGGLTARWRY